jgi:galactose mutarotase-like enzyme
MYTLQSSQLKVKIDEKGAELKSVIHAHHQLEYMWSGDPTVWGKTSPVLFPIVGALKENKYEYKEQTYQLPRHGFARDRVFSVINQPPNTLIFSISSDEETRKVYPFDFRFLIIYEVQDDTLSVTYQVENRGEETLFFSVGGHPAFKLPLIDGTEYEDYKLVFEKEETVRRWPIGKAGLIENEPLPLLEGTRELPLSKELFRKDAVVLKELNSTSVKLLSDKTDHGLQFDFECFPYLGLWAAPGADFLCIEPWCGIADSVDTNQEFTSKEGIISLPAEEEFSVTWRVRFF